MRGQWQCGRVCGWEPPLPPRPIVRWESQYLTAFVLLPSVPVVTALFENVLAEIGWQRCPELDCEGTSIALFRLDEEPLRLQGVNHHACLRGESREAGA